ncbi:putative ribonuclease H-like domain-containing protein [Tanacetum coccineum]
MQRSYVGSGSFLLCSIVKSKIAIRERILNTVGQNFLKAAISVNTVRPINTAYPRSTVNSARTISNIFNRAHSHVRRPFNKSTINKNNNLKEKVNAVNGNVTTAGPKAVVSDNKRNEANAVKRLLHIMKKLMVDLLHLEEIPKRRWIENHGKGKTLYRVPRKDNMYSVDLKNIVHSGGIENLIDLKVKVIRCDNGTEFKNKVMNQFCEMKGIKREFSVARTPQQNGVAERKNRTLIEAARTMLADSKLPTTFWAEAVNTACYVQNRVLVIKPHNKTPYELFLGRKPALSFMRPFRCPVTILNTLDHLGNQTNGNAGTKENIDAGQARKKIVPNQEYILLPLLKTDPSLSKSSKDSPDARFKPSGAEKKMDYEHPENEDSEVPNTEESRVNQYHDANVNSTNNINTVYPTVNAADIENNVVDENIVYGCIDDPSMPNLEEIVYSDDDEEVGAKADMNNLATTVAVSPIPTTRVHKDHPLEQIIGDIHSAPQTRRMTKNVTEHVEPKKVIQALTDPSWIKAMQDELLHKKDDRDIVVRNKARLVAHGYTQEEGIDYDDVFAPVARIDAIRLFLAYASFMNFIVYQMDVKSAFLYDTIEEEVYVCQLPGFEDPEFPNKVYKVEKALYGLHQAPRAWYETLSAYLLENEFRRGTIDKTLFIKKEKDDILLVQVYVDDIIFGSTKKSLCTEFKQMMHKRLQVKQKDDGIFISQDKYVADILKKFDFATVKTANTPIKTNKALLKDEEATDVDVHLYSSMIGSLMYLTASRPDIMFAVCACAMFQVTPKTLHLHAVKRIFRYLKGHPKLGLWYPRDSPFDLEAFSYSDYAGASLDRKSTTGGCQFLGRKLISWQCKKHTIVANSTTEAKYVAAANCCGHVLWIQNQLLDYGYNFLNTKIFIDNESTICIIKNPVFHSKTKHIDIRHHFIRDLYEKRLIQVIKIHTDHNVADLLKKAFDVSRFQYLIVNKTVIKEWEDRIKRAATTAFILKAEQDSGNIIRTQSMATLNKPFPQGTDSGSGPRDPLSQLQGKFVQEHCLLSSLNRGILLGFIDLMRQKNKRMKQEGLIRHYGILQKMEDSTRYAKEGNKINIKDLLEKDKDYDLKRFSFLIEL